MKKAIFLDRDGIINVDHSYVYKKENFEFCEGIFETLQHFLSLDYQLFIVTNQSGIGRGYYSEDDFEKLTSWMLKEFTCRGIKITKVYYCPHSPSDGCTCRKPEIEMFKKGVVILKKELHSHIQVYILQLSGNLLVPYLTPQAHVYFQICF